MLILSDRISTVTANGSAISVPSTFTWGELMEIRATSALSNTQFQGMFMEIRTSVANTSTIRGIEVHAAQEGAVAVGVLEGGSFQAITRSSTTGNITNMFGVTGEVTHNDSAYTGTVTAAAAVRGKLSVEDGATYTYASIIRAEISAITGGKTIDAAISVHADSSATVNYLIDTSNIESTNYSANRVVLWKFKDSAGTARFLVFDADSATAVVVDSDEVE